MSAAPNGKDSPLDFTISKVCYASDTTPTGSTVGSELNAIKDGLHREPIERIRRVWEDTPGDRKAKKQAVAPFKKALPGILWAGRFNVRNADGLLARSGLLCVDLDDLPDIAAARTALVSDPHVCALFVSPTGTGLKVLVRIDTGRPHLEGFMAVEAYFKERHGLPIDPSGKDVSRLCFASWDPELYVNDGALLLPYPEQVTNTVAGKEQRIGSEHSDGVTPLPSSDATPEQIRELLKSIPPRPPYDVWLKIISAVSSAVPEEQACELLSEWSPEERPGEYQEKCKHRLTKIGIGTLIHYARHGWQPPEQPRAYFDPPRKTYWIENGRGQWINIAEVQLVRQFKPFLRAKRAQDEPLSPLEQHLNFLQKQRDIDFAGPLAGAQAGLQEFEGHRILVTDSPKIIAAVPGEWPILRRLIDNLLIDAVADQTPYFFGWMKCAREALTQDSTRPGQALAIAGPRDCGKSLLQSLITFLLGGRSAKPYGWMTASTDFNSELFGAEHLIIDDEVAGTDIRARRNFGARIKMVTVNNVQECHAKHRPKLILAPFWRLTITLNDEPENLMVLPPLDDSLLDKISLLRANKRTMPMPTDTIEERKALWETLEAELPAFCAFLEQWQIPAELQSGRFGITHFHHPELLSAINDLAPETKLLQLIEADLPFDDDGKWTGTAADLERILFRDGCPAQFEARKLLTFNTACGVYLGRLANKHPDRVSKDRTRDERFWTIRRSAELRKAAELIERYPELE